MRILKELDRQVFKERFTNKQDCFELLAELKCQDGYHCKRCESNMYINGKQPESRRCSKCSYDESTTTGILSALGSVTQRLDIMDRLNQAFRSGLIIQ
jgi:hypothetical protein